QVRPGQQGQPGQPNQPNQQPQPNVNPAQPVPQDIIIEDVFERAKKTVRLVADDRTNSLIVYANDEGLKRVRDMLEIIDKPLPSNYRTFELAHARAEQLQGMVEQIARGFAGGGAGRNPQRSGATVIADSDNNALHVVADRELMTHIAEVIAELDIPGAE